MHAVAYSKYGPLVICLELSRPEGQQHSAPKSINVVAEIPDYLVEAVDAAADGDWILVDEDVPVILGIIPEPDNQVDREGYIMDGTPYERPALEHRPRRPWNRHNDRGPHPRSAQPELGEEYDEL